MSRLTPEDEFVELLRGAFGVACEYDMALETGEEILDQRVETVLQREINGFRWSNERNAQRFAIMEGKSAGSIESALWLGFRHAAGSSATAERLIGLKLAWGNKLVREVYEATEREAREAAREMELSGPRGDGALTIREASEDVLEVGGVALDADGSTTSVSRGFAIKAPSGFLDVMDIWRKLEDVSAEAGASGWMVAKSLLRMQTLRIRCGKGAAIVHVRTGARSVDVDKACGVIAGWAKQMDYLNLGLNRNRPPLTTWLPRAVGIAMDEVVGISDDPRFVVRDRFWSEVLNMGPEQRRESLEAIHQYVVSSADMDER